MTTNTATGFAGQSRASNLTSARPGHHLRESAIGQSHLYSPRGRGALAGDIRELGEIPARRQRKSIRSFGWPSSTISSRPFIRFRTATAGHGRSINILVLIEEDFSTCRSLPQPLHSTTIAATTIVFSSCDVARGAWEPWLLYMLSAVEETSVWTLKKIRAIKVLMDETVAPRQHGFSRIVQPGAGRDDFHSALSARTNDLVADGHVGHRKTASEVSEGAGGARRPQGGEGRARQDLRLGIPRHDVQGAIP